MDHKIASQLRIAICGSASVGKTALVNAMSGELGLPCIGEEMRDYLEATETNLAQLPRAKVAEVLIRLWKGRAEQERQTPGFIADNCPLDFAAYGLYYGCMDASVAGILLDETLRAMPQYDAVFVLPWGVLPYEQDGVRPISQYDQLRYQMILEGLLGRYLEPAKVHFLPAGATDLTERCRWVGSEMASLEERVPESKKGAAESDDAGPRKGTVYLVGAGPGDPGLLTVRAFELLSKADVVAHDSLVPQGILDRIPATVELVPVGRRHGEGKRAYRLHPEILARARAGQTVVRLKSGDPLLFGRGGEEAEELAEAGIPFEIVPGVSAAFGAAAYAGIPLTYRGVATDVMFTTGHEADEASTGVEEEHRNETKRRTTVLFMAARKLETNLARLIRQGYTPDTPVALVASATTERQQVAVGTIANLAEKIRGIDPANPALLIVGEVVNLRDTVAWFENALRGRRVLVARARPGCSGTARSLRHLGAEVVEAPAVSSAPLIEYVEIDRAFAGLDRFDAVVFGSADGVRFSIERLRQARREKPLSAIAIGAQAHQALRAAQIDPVAATSGSCREALLEHSWAFTGKRLLLIGSDERRPGLLKELSGLSASVETVAVYRSMRDFFALERNKERFDAIVLPSSSAARLLLRHRAGLELMDVPMVAMGPETQEVAIECGAKHVVCAVRDDIESIVSCVVQQLAADR